MKELQRWELTITPEGDGGQMVRRKDGGWTPYHDAISAMNSLQREVDACNRALEAAEAREAELRARVAELEGMLSKFLPPAHLYKPAPVDNAQFLQEREQRNKEKCAPFDPIPAAPKEEV